MADISAEPGAEVAVWRRIERERPRGYWEMNVVEGRRLVRRRIAEKLGGLDGPRVADLGCGGSLLAAVLRERGARVVAIDRLPGVLFRPRPREGGVVADLRRPLFRNGGLDALVLSEVVEDLDFDQRCALLRAIDEWRAERLLLVARCPTRWSRLRASVQDPRRLPEIDPIELLRTVHLETAYRLVGREEVRRRNYRALIAEFRHTQDEREV